jgi:hypothetical protein
LDDRSRSRLERAWPHAAHAVIAVWIAGAAATGERLLVFRDLGYLYLPQYVALSKGLAEGLWPLWNPFINGGQPSFRAYPPELILLTLLEPAHALGATVLLHLVGAMSGMTLLARRMGCGPAAAWLAGSAYGLSGPLLSLVNLLPLFHAATWLPWVVLAWLRVRDEPGAASGALLGLAAALQVSTLGIEVVLLTAVFGLVAAPPRRDPWPWTALLWAGVVAILTSAPAWVGTLYNLRDSPRASGLDVRGSMAFSAHPMALLDAVVPRFFGDVHTFSNVGYWGQPYFPEGFPYLLSLYLGLPVIALAFRAGRRDVGLWILVLLGTLVALGSHGPIGPLAEPVARILRSPVKGFLLAAAAVALLAARGLERPVGRTTLVLSTLPGLAHLLGALVVSRVEFADVRLAHVAREVWPAAFLVSGALATACALALAPGPRGRLLAAGLATLELGIASSFVHTTAPRIYLAVPSPVAALVETMRREGGRVLSYTLDVQTKTFLPHVVASNDDVWLYYADRETLAPEYQVVNGLRGALSDERTGFEPEGSTLPLSVRRPGAFSRHYRDLLLAGVRFVLSVEPIDDPRLKLVGQAPLVSLRQPLLVYRMRDALPEAFWVPEGRVVADLAQRRAQLSDPSLDPRQTVLLAAPLPARSTPAPAGTTPARVQVERLDSHRLRLDAHTPPGYVVVMEGYDPAWTATSAGPVVRGNRRSLVLSTPGGHLQTELVYAPPWPTPALAAGALGLLGAGWALARGRRAGRPSITRLDAPPAVDAGDTAAPRRA